MIKYPLTYLFILISVLYGEISLDSLVGNYCYPNCKKSNSILMINSDSTFNFKTMLHGGFSKAGTLQILKDNKVELKTTQKINLGTHTFFIGEIIDCKTLNPDERVAYMGDTRMKYGGVPRGGH